MKFFDKGYNLLRNFFQKKVVSKNKINKNHIFFKETFFNDFSKQKLFNQEFQKIFNRKIKKKEEHEINKNIIQRKINHNISETNLNINEENKKENINQSTKKEYNSEIIKKNLEIKEKKFHKKTIKEENKKNNLNKKIQKNTENSIKKSELLKKQKNFEITKKEIPNEKNTKIIKKNSIINNLKKSKTDKRIQKSSEKKPYLKTKKVSSQKIIKKFDLQIAKIEKCSKIKYSKISYKLTITIKNKKKKNYFFTEKNFNSEKIEGKKILIINNFEKSKRHKSDLQILLKKNPKNESDFLIPKNGKIGENFREENFLEDFEENFDEDFLFHIREINKYSKFFWVDEDGILFFDEFPLFLENGDKIIIDESI